MRSPHRRRKPHTSTRGLPPGTLRYTGTQRVDKPILSLFEYAPDTCQEETIGVDDPRAQIPANGRQRWLDLEGLHDVELIGRLGSAFKLHPLALEDILHIDQRPKLDDYDDYLFIVAHMVTALPDERMVQKEQVSFVLGRGWLLTFQEGHAGDPFGVVRDHLRKGHTRIRQLPIDFLLYSLLDAIVDQYFEAIEKFGDWVEELEDELVACPTQQHVQRIYHLKRELAALRRSVWPLREVIGVLSKNDSKLLDAHTIIYLRDLYDHSIQAMETVETYRDVLSGMLDIYLSSISNRMNEIMKVLTMIATVFIPLTFIAGVYGMNFEFMPELHSRWGYPAVWAVMLILAGCMLVYFKKKKWL